MTPGIQVAIGMMDLLEKYMENKYKMNTSTWIKISDRKPTEADLPIIMCGFSSDLGWVTTSLINAVIHPALTGEPWTHWFPMSKIPPAPCDKEPTQEENDRAAFAAFYDVSEDRSMEAAFHHALSLERSALRHLIKQYSCGEIPAPELIRQISKRVKLQ